MTTKPENIYLQILIIVEGCRYNSVYVYINCFQIVEKKTQALGELKEISLFLVFHLRCLMGPDHCTVYKI